jgi:hypothetical protein
MLAQRKLPSNGENENLDKQHLAGYTEAFN